MGGKIEMNNFLISLEDTTFNYLIIRNKNP